MENRSVRKICGFFAAMALIFAVCAVGIFLTGDPAGYADTQTVPDQEPPGQGAEYDESVISCGSGFYTRDFRIRIKPLKGCRMKYTLDAEDPAGEKGIPYEAPIEIPVTQEETLIVLRVAAIDEDGRVKKEYTRNYFCGENIQDRYETMIVSIVGDPDGLFGYENGILVPGEKYDTFMKENPGAHPGAGVTANYTATGRESERAVYIETFDEKGNVLTSQNGGVRVAGMLSRMNHQKSLRLYARKEYDEQNEFDYDFFGDLRSEDQNVLGQEYKRLLLKNSGQDHGYGYLRGELIGSLAAEAGFADTQHVRPACVYINGMYYGAYWLSNAYDKSYFQNRYGESDGEFVVVGDSDRVKTADEEADLPEKNCADEYNAFYRKYAAADLTDESLYGELCQKIDVENYLQYFAIENYVGNDDWPDSNVKAYRYVAGKDGYGEGAKDGRYRMLLFDADYGFGLLFYHETIGTLVNAMTLDKILYESSDLFAALMQREDCREYFVSCTLDLMNGSMRAENVARRTEEFHQSRRAELSRTIDAEGLTGGLLLEEEITMDTVERNMQRIKDYAGARPVYVLQDIAEKFGWEDTYQLTVSSASDYSGVRINTVYAKKYSDADGTFGGTYLRDVPITLTPVPGRNEVFAHWLVNGKEYAQETLILDRAMTGDSDAVAVELVTREVPEPRLHILSVSARGADDLVELVNDSSAYLGTEGYYLTDGEDAYRYALPAVVLAPGEKIAFAGKDNTRPESLFKYALNFDLKEGETLALTCYKETADALEIPGLSRDGVYIRNAVTGEFEEEK